MKDLTGKNSLEEGIPRLVLCARKSTFRPHGFQIIQELKDGTVHNYRTDFSPASPEEGSLSSNVTRIIFGKGEIRIEPNFVLSHGKEEKKFQEHHNFCSIEITPSEADQIKTKLNDAKADEYMYSVSGESSGSSAKGEVHNCNTFWQSVLNEVLKDKEKVGRQTYFTKLFPQTPKAGVREAKRLYQPKKDRECCSLV